MPWRRQTVPSCSSGWSTPISLLAAITLTSRVSGVIAASSCSGLISPSGPGVSRVTLKPSRCSCWSGSSTAWCSVATLIRWPLPRARAWPSSARLLASVAPLVNTNRSGFTSNASASWRRATFTAAEALRPSRCWRLEGLPQSALQNGAIASTTSAAQGVVAWKSKARAEPLRTMQADVAIMVLHCERHWHGSAIANGSAGPGRAGVPATRQWLRP